MFDIIEKKVEQIRKKPRYIRKRYLWFWVTLIMFFVIFIWFISLRITFYNMGDDTEETNDTNTTNQTFTDLQQSIKNLQTDTSPAPSTSINDLLEQSDTTTELPESEL
jgi:predicted PurR-regulated permease PerM